MSKDIKGFRFIALLRTKELGKLMSLAALTLIKEKGLKELLLKILFIWR
jgi:hypothetical protein